MAGTLLHLQSMLRAPLHLQSVSHTLLHPHPGLRPSLSKRACETWVQEAVRLHAAGAACPGGRQRRACRDAGRARILTRRCHVCVAPCVCNTGPRSRPAKTGDRDVRKSPAPVPARRLSHTRSPYARSPYAPLVGPAEVAPLAGPAPQWRTGTPGNALRGEGCAAVLHV